MANQLAAPGVEVFFESLERMLLPTQHAAAFAERAREATSFAVGRSTVAVRFSRADTARAFAARYGDLRSTGRPDLTVFVIEDANDAYFWAAGRDRVWRWRGGALDPETAAFFADSVALYEFLCAFGYVGFHAAVVAGVRGAAALIGDTTAGKTTTALACVRRGLRLYSDERCILEEGAVVPFLRRMNIRPGGRAALAADPLEDPLGIDRRLSAWAALGDVAVRPSELAATLAGGPPRPLTAVFLIEDRAKTPRAVRTGPIEAMPFILSSMASRDSGLDRIARVLHELRNVALYRLRLGTPDDTACLIAGEIGAPEQCANAPN